MKLSFVIVNYKSEVFLKKCLDSLRQNVADDSYEVVIVNNDSVALSSDVLDSFPNVHILNRATNDGFARACNAGAEIASGEFLFFLNPDTELKSPNSEELITALQQPGVGIVAPKLITPAGESQAWSAGHTVGLWDILQNNLGHIRSEKLWEQETVNEVDWVSGAAFVISKKLFDAQGGFDEKFFMYFEDIDLCRRVRLQGQKILRVPQVSVLHLGGQSYRDEKKQKRHYYASQDYYFKKHAGALSSLLLKPLRSLSLLLKKA